MIAHSTTIFALCGLKLSLHNNDLYKGARLIVVLAEKPSVARDIASVVGANTKRDGYFEGNGYAVTYAFGHLVTLAEPEDMNPAWGKPWRIQQLPMIPSDWKYRVVEKSASQFNVIKKLFCDPATTSIICATDAGREGEHIFRLIYKLSGSSHKVERLWISSLTAEAIKDGLKKLKAASEFDNLAYAAASRAHADWVVGLNFTRAYTTMNNQLCTIGRVQTPTLALIVDRQTAIDNFKSTPFYEILVNFEPGFLARYITPGEEPQTRLSDRAVAQSIYAAIKPAPSGVVQSVITQEKKTKAPALYDLLTLQKDANKRFGYTAQETLNIAQSLYEEYKLISYPRTESRHLSNDMVAELPRVLSMLLKSSLASQKVKDAFAKESIVPGAITASLIKPKLSKSYVDDAKLTDHHAIIPTHNPMPASLPDKQKNVYQLVATRFLSIFLPPEVRDETTVIIAIAEHSVRARGIVIKDPGWTILEPKAKEAEKKGKDKDAAEETQQLPPLQKGDTVIKQKAELKEKKTNPPKPYDDATLLTAMKNAGQELDDEDLASYMKQKGLGTPATRAAIIERLLQTGYLERNKKALSPTEKGKALITQVHSDLKDIALTASWEQRLADMQDGKLLMASFEEDIASFVRRILPDVTEAGPVLPPKVGSGIGICPQCQKGVVRQTPKGAGCNRWKEGCTFSIWREQRGKSLTDNQIKELVENRQTKVIKGFKKKDSNETYDARLVLNDDFKVVLEGSAALAGDAASVLGICPQCQAGTVKPTPKGAGCSRWREGCKFSIWREVNGKQLTDEQMKALVENKGTEIIKGFQKKSGTGTYDARLVLNEEFKVRLEFASAMPAGVGATKNRTSETENRTPPTES
ncbi:MAG: DNA topoisomerase 3 [Candidatus Obscuribacter sp.]|nr:DNA topoisomerase 3 [Candidatus Obscuribacter sp.]